MEETIIVNSLIYGKIKRSNPKCCNNSIAFKSQGQSDLNYRQRVGLPDGYPTHRLLKLNLLETARAARNSTSVQTPSTVPADFDDARPDAHAHDTYVAHGISPLAHLLIHTHFIYLFICF